MPTIHRRVIATAELTDVDAATQELYRYFEWTVSTIQYNLLAGTSTVKDRGVMVWTKKYADGDAREDWFRDIGESEQWPSSAALTGMGLVDGQLVPMRDNADDSILELLARPDPTLTNFIVGANSRAHHLVVAIFDFLRTHDKDGGEIGRALA